MANPWLDIPLPDYEAHMALPTVAQASMLSDTFASMLAQYRPSSVAVIGCAGGNGFERIDTQHTTRVVGVDINARYLEGARERFDGVFVDLELVCANIEISALVFAPVDLIFAGLVFEYVDADAVVPALAERLASGGILGCVLQLPATGKSAVTASPFTSLQRLTPILRLLPPEQLIAQAQRCALELIVSERIELATGKCFQVLQFRAES